MPSPAAPSPMTDLKTCNRCKRDYPATPEHFHRSGVGLRNICKRCRNSERYGRRKAKRAGVAFTAEAAPPEMLLTRKVPDCRSCRLLAECTAKVAAKIPGDRGDPYCFVSSPWHWLFLREHDRRAYGTLMRRLERAQA